MKKAIRPTVYDSAIDLWIAALILLSPAVAAAIGIYMLVNGNASGATYVFLVGSAALLITIAFTIPCRYTILDDALSIRCGIIFFQIPLSQINSVEPSRSWLSGPALSMRRVKVMTSTRTVIVSPKERQEFITDLTVAANLATEKQSVRSD